jgi:hypothetical protein
MANIYQIPNASIMACDVQKGYKVFIGPGTPAVVLETANKNNDRGEPKKWLNFGGHIGWYQYDRHAMVPVLLDR